MCFCFRSMLPDVVDDFKVQNPTSQGHEAIFYSFYVFFTKFASGVSLGVSTLSLRQLVLFASVLKSSFMGLQQQIIIWVYNLAFTFHLLMFRFFCSPSLQLCRLCDGCLCSVRFGESDIEDVGVGCSCGTYSSGAAHL